jgi:hypothetical protein
MKYFKGMPDFCIEITPENREDMKYFFSNCLNLQSAAFNIGVWYGVRHKWPDALGVSHNAWMPIITYEELEKMFEKSIINNTYEIY